MLLPELQNESGVFCQKRIGLWSEDKFSDLLGAPQRQRAAYSDAQVENGRIYAHADPSHRYRQLELEFDKTTGLLRAVYVYPWKMTWQECQRRFGSRASAADAKQGRKFYSYADRHLDVLVDTNGTVINLGLY